MTAIGKIQTNLRMNEYETDKTSLKIARSDFEKNFILDALEKNDWKISETAKDLGIDRTNLFKKMQKYGINKIDTDN